jgi:DNA polymerase-3 subunit gamma/tau
MCARVLLPAADDGMQGVRARLDRIERRMAIAGAEHTPARPEPRQPTGPATPGSAPAADTAEGSVTADPAVEPTAGPAAGNAARPDPRPDARPDTRPSGRPPDPVREKAPPAGPAGPAGPARAAGPAVEQPPTASPEPPAVTPTAPGLGLVDVRRAWPDVVDRTKSARRLAWSLLSQSAQVHALDGSTLTIAFVNAGSRDSFARNGCDEVLRQVLIDVLGVDWRVECIVDPSATPAPAPASTTTPSPAAAPTVPASATGNGPELAVPATGSAAQTRSAVESRRRPGSPTVPEKSPPAQPARATASAAATEGAHLDDDDVPDGDDTHELLTRELGAQVIEEIPHQP